MLLTGNPHESRSATEMADTDFKPGLEGVIAFESEIAEPDKEGSALRYRGVDIEDLVGNVSFGNVWGLLSNVAHWKVFEKDMGVDNVGVYPMPSPTVAADTPEGQDAPNGPRLSRGAAWLAMGAVALALLLVYLAVSLLYPEKF